MLLKRIAGQLPPYLVKLLAPLEAVDIRTTEHIIFTPPSTIHSLVPSLPQHLLELLSAHCLSLTGPPVISGSSQTPSGTSGLPRGAQPPTSSWAGWGLDGLDGLLQGWDGVGVLEIAGPKRAGKSLLALHAALRMLATDPQATCTWIDTGGGFDPQRAKGVLESWGVDDVDGVLDRLVISRCFSLEPDIYDAIGKIETSLEQETLEENSPRVKVLVIDSITNLFKDTLMGTTSQGHAAMVTLMSDLASDLTYKHNLLTIVTNSTASSVPTNPLSNFSSTTIKPALGTAFTYHSDVTLLVQETGKVFGLVDEVERERVRAAPGLRSVVEVLKSRVSDGFTMQNVMAESKDDERTLRMSAGLPTGVQRPFMGPLRETLAS